MLIDMLVILLLLLDMLPTAHPPALALLVLPPLLFQLLLVDMPVLDVMLPTLLVSFMLLSVRLMRKLTQLTSMELTDMLVLDMLDMLDILMLMDMLAILLLLLDMLPTAHPPAQALLVLPLLLSQLLLVDMPVLDAMLPTLLELFMLPKNLKF